MSGSALLGGMGLALVRGKIVDAGRRGRRPGHLAARAALADSDDATLARALIARDPRAPRVLWQRFAPMVFRMLRRTLGADHDLDNLAQEVFLCVFEKVRALREPKALKAFVISVTSLTMRHELRRRWVRRWVRLSGKTDAAELEIVTPDTDAREALGPLLQDPRSRQRHRQVCVRVALHGGAGVDGGRGRSQVVARDDQAATGPCLGPGDAARRARPGPGRITAQVCRPRKAARRADHEVALPGIRGRGSVSHVRRHDRASTIRTAR